MLANLCIMMQRCMVILEEHEVAQELADLKHGPVEPEVDGS